MPTIGSNILRVFTYLLKENPVVEQLSIGICDFLKHKDKDNLTNILETAINCKFDSITSQIYN